MPRIITPSIGDLDRQIILQYKTRVTDGMGGFTDTYVTAATVWAKITTLRSDEAVQAMATTATVVHNITIRYRTDVRSGWRVKYGSRYFAIIGPPIDLNMQHKFIELKCKESA